MTPGMCPVLTPRARLAGFVQGPLVFLQFQSMGANDPQDVASLGPRGLIGRIYVGDH